MRRHSRWVHVWAIGCVLAISGIAVVPALSGRASDAPSAPPTLAVPFGFQHLVVVECVDVNGFVLDGEMAISSTAGAAPFIEHMALRLGDTSVSLPAESPQIRRIQACLDGFEYEAPTRAAFTQSRAEQLVVYDWLVTFVRPCLSSHGLAVNGPSVTPGGCVARGSNVST